MDLPRDRIASFFAERTPRRLLALALFVGGIILFRQLLILLVFFVIFERSFEWLGLLLRRRLKMKRKAALAICFGLFTVVLGVGLTVGITRLVKMSINLKDTLPERIAAIQQLPLYEKVREQVENLDSIVDTAKHYATGLLGYLSTIGHVAVYLVIGFILALVFLLDREKLTKFGESIEPTSLLGTMLRWLGHLSDAVFVTVQFQLVVAACNAVLTIPVLLIVGVKHVASLALLIFGSGLVPVVGNFVCGAILTVLAYQASGWVGVVLFTVLTFVLHKLESFYLNPRLASRHVQLPGFVLIVSLLCWEHLLGFVGLFVSFPFLFLAMRIGQEFKRENEGLAPTEEHAPAFVGDDAAPTGTGTGTGTETGTETGSDPGSGSGSDSGSGSASASAPAA